MCQKIQSDLQKKLGAKINQTIMFFSLQEKGSKRKMISDKVEKPLWEKRKVFGAKIRNMCEGQLLDPSNL